MPGKSFRLLIQATVEDGARQDLSEALDLIDQGQIDIVCTVHTPGVGESPQLLLQHAPVNEEEAYIAFEEPIAIDLTTAGTAWVHVSRFTRWVTWLTSGTLTEGAVVSLDIVARS